MGSDQFIRLKTKGNNDSGGWRLILRDDGDRTAHDAIRPSAGHCLETTKFGSHIDGSCHIIGVIMSFVTANDIAIVLSGLDFLEFVF